jgi:hypothetical protein
MVACELIPVRDEPLPEQQQVAVSAEVAQKPAACECPVVIEAEPVSCPEIIKPVEVATAKRALIDDLLVIGRIENVTILPDMLVMKARIDTGAGMTSMAAGELVEFERDGKAWVRFSITGRSQQAVEIERPVARYIEIKQHNGESQRRPVVLIGLSLGPIEEQVEVSLTDRSEYLYRLLIGRNFLRDRAIVNVSRKFTIKVPVN